MNRMTISIMVRWYCRVCWKQGLTNVTIMPMRNKLVEPTKEELLRIVEKTMLNKCCDASDMRVYEEKDKRSYDLKSKYPKAN